MNNKEKLIAKFKGLFKNTYFFVLIGALIWMIFFDRYNLVSQYRMKQQIEQLKQDKVYYEIGIEAVDYEYEKLYNDPDELERYAREKYYMKRPGEDVFIIVDEEEEE